MVRRLVCAVLALCLAAPVAAQEATVEVPWNVWQEMLLERLAAAETPPPALPFSPVSRRIEGRFRKGLVEATLTARFVVYDDSGWVTVPVLDGAASLAEVRVNGAEGALLREGPMYVLGVDEPGEVELVVRFFLGQEQDRFARKLQFRLPPAGLTDVQLTLPEAGIDAKLASGVVTSQEEQGDSTILEGCLDASGAFDLSWTRRLTHREGAETRMEARLDTLFTVQEDVVTGVALVDFRVLEGEIDRVDLELPEGIEVLKVVGDAVLQWRTEARAGGRLTLLLRYLVSDHVRVAVHFQMPCDPTAPVRLATPLPPEGVATTGLAGVQAPAGLNVRLADPGTAEALTLRDLPPELTDLTTSPLLFGLRFERQPGATVAVSRHEQVALMGTVVDEIEASTVLMADGVEVTKLKLHMRNNTRQYLSLVLPEGAVPTHSLVDGQPIRPAVDRSEGREALLFPLRQSQRLDGAAQRTHLVHTGETLGSIANLYYADPGKWPLLLEANFLSDDTQLQVGQALRIPNVGSAQHEESRFVIELAYRRPRARLGHAGRVAVRLPELDVESMKVTWHLYLPESLTPLGFDGNLTQLSARRYDPFRRALDFLDEAFGGRFAFAGGGVRYQSILKQRKAIFHEESERKAGGQVVLASFPLVGERYRFKRILAGRAAPAITVTYISDTLASGLRWGAAGVAFLLALFLLGRRRPWWAWLVALVVLAGLLVVGHYVIGTHRLVLTAFNLALLLRIGLLRVAPSWERFRARVQTPERFFEVLTFANLVRLVGLAGVLSFVLRFPALLSLVLFVVLLVVWRLSPRKEAAHA